jgi:NAD(P)-dependent dehydrogenase (short-subunit alcohol dehydrogenase family)
MRLEGKVALITGGGTGLGLATARLFAREGARVAICGRRPEVLRQAAEQVGGDCLVLPADAAEEAQMRGAVDAAVARFGRLDALVHAAGVQVRRADLADTTLAAFEAALRGNLTSAFLASREAARAMGEGGGSIVLIGSTAGVVGTSLRLSYSAAKAGMQGMVRQMSLSLGRRGVRANLIAPGLILTDMTRDILGGLPEERLSALVASFPIPRLGRPEDIAEAALWLASDGSSWVTGLTIPVDGGFSSTRAI